MPLPRFEQLGKPVYIATEHFLNASTSGVTGIFGLSLNTNGTGSGASIAAVSNRIGVLQLTTGTTATGSAGQRTATTVFNSSGSLTYSLEYDFQLPTVSTSGETFTIGLGFNNTGSQTGSAHGAFLTCNDTNFIAVNRLSSTSTNTTLAAVDTAWHNYKVSFNSTSVIHTLDGTATAVSTNIPLNQSLAAINSIVKTVGTTARTINIDFLTVRVD